jgi:Flp pilus assembly protein TadG
MKSRLLDILDSRRSRWPRRFEGLLSSDRGAVMFEFVIVVPMMLFILLGFTEMYLYMRAVSLVEHTAFTLADSIGQMPQVINDTSTSNANNLGSIWSAATLLAAPNALQAQGGVIVTSICDLTTTPCGVTQPLTQSMLPGVPKIYWQAQAPWTQSGMTSKITSTNILPSSWPFRNGDSAIVVEVFMKYTPFSMTLNFWASAPGTQTIYERVYVRQRYGQALTLAAAS